MNDGEHISKSIRILRWVIRYCVHWLIVYQIVDETLNLSDRWHRHLVRAHSPGTPQDGLQFFMGHFLLLSIVPGFLAGLLLNAKFRHSAARFVWIPPALIFTAMLVLTPALWDHDIAGGVREFSKRYLQGVQWNAPGNEFGPAWYIAYQHIRVTMPLLAGIAYSVGASVGMSAILRRFQRIAAKL